MSQKPREYNLKKEEVSSQMNYQMQNIKAQ